MSDEIDTDQSGPYARCHSSRCHCRRRPGLDDTGGPVPGRSGFRAGGASRRLDEDCDEVFQFKIDGAFTSFSSGEAPFCSPTGYDKNAKNFVAGRTPRVSSPTATARSRSLSLAGTATITIPADCTLLDGQAKAGSPNGDTLECEDATPMPGGSGVYTVTLPTRNISFVAGVICC